MTWQLNNDGIPEVISFEASHTHELTLTPMKHVLRSYRKITPADKAIASIAEKTGISIKSTIDLITVQNRGREHNGYLDIDYRNYVASTRKIAMQKGDGHALMEYFWKMKLEDPSYFHAIQFDDGNSILNIFWADARSIVDHSHFGNVVCFDTTYRTIGYSRPFALFVGVNHHKNTMIFSAALLYDETKKSFKWLFKTFLSAMSGKEPKTILTDQCLAIANAIGIVFPKSHPHSCVWHLYQNVTKHLSHVFHSLGQFAKDFNACMYDYEDEDEWLEAWQKMLENYSLINNNWLQGIF